MPSRSLPAFPLLSQQVLSEGLPQPVVPWAFGECLNHSLPKARLICGLGKKKKTAVLHLIPGALYPSLLLPHRG